MSQVILAFEDTIYESGIDGNERHRLPVDGYCSYPAVTNDGHWMACVSTSAEENDWLHLVALQPTDTSQEHQTRLSVVHSFSSLAWSPDGQYLAAAIKASGAPCSVAIFSSPAPHAMLTRIVNITSAQFDGQYGLCGIHSITWSVDSQRLFVLSAGVSIFMATVAVGRLLQAVTTTPPGNSVSYEVPTDHIQTFTFADMYGYDSLLFLNSQRDTLFFTSSGSPEHLMSFNLHTKQLKTVFILPGTYQINALTWMPNGRQLLIAVGDHPCVDCGAYAISDVYLFSPEALPKLIPAGTRTEDGT